MPAELGEMDGRNAAAATVGLVNGKANLGGGEMDGRNAAAATVGLVNGKANLGVESITTLWFLNYNNNIRELII